MKKKQIAILLGMTLCMMPLSSCSADAKTDTKQEETTDSEDGDGFCNVFISQDSSWIVTGDSTVKGLYCAGTISDAEGNTVTIKGTDGIVYVEGTSDYTITTESYEDQADLSSASKTTSWSDYEVEKPAEL